MTRTGVALLSAGVLAGGCAGPHSGAGLQPGRATAQEVEALMGPAAGRDIWSYPMRVRNGDDEPQVFIVQVSLDGVVREALFINDPEFDC